MRTAKFYSFCVDFGPILTFFHYTFFSLSATNFPISMREPFYSQLDRRTEWQTNRYQVKNVQNVMWVPQFLTYSEPLVFAAAEWCWRISRCLAARCQVPGDNGGLPGAPGGPRGTGLADLPSLTTTTARSGISSLRQAAFSRSRGRSLPPSGDQISYFFIWGKRWFTSS